jgi:hypothetical protein
MKCGLAAAVMVAVMVATAVVASAADAASCAGDAASARMDQFFSSDDAAGLSGGDYPHVLPLPDGRVLWTLQDAFVGADANLRDDQFFHNVGMVQSGTCFSLLLGGRGSWIGSGVEIPLRHWYWPLDAELGADGYLWVFVAEMSNPRGTGAATGAVPTATWRARVSLPELRVVDLAPATDPSTELFGYSIVSDNTWWYLYGHCYRQFLPDSEQGFDPACSPFAYLARVPRGHFELPLEYWSTQGWTRDRSAMTPGPHGEPDRAGVGPTVRRSAFVMPVLESGRVVIAYSNNAWTMDPDAFDRASLYRISFAAIAVPDVPHINFPAVTVSGHRRSIGWIGVVVLLLVGGIGSLRWRATRFAARLRIRRHGRAPLTTSPRTPLEDARAARR